ncbi:hypothetical protein D3C71_1854720 [compost metagenome]
MAFPDRLDRFLAWRIDDAGEGQHGVATFHIRNVQAIRHGTASPIGEREQAQSLGPSVRGHAAPMVDVERTLATVGQFPRAHVEDALGGALDHDP